MRSMVKEMSQNITARMVCHMECATGTSVDRWHTFSNYVQRYGIPYSSSVKSTDYMRLNKKRIINGTSETSLYVTGLYNP